MVKSDHLCDAALEVFGRLGGSPGLSPFFAKVTNTYKQDGLVVTMPHKSIAIVKYDSGYVVYDRYNLSQVSAPEPQPAPQYYMEEAINAVFRDLAKVRSYEQPVRNNPFIAPHDYWSTSCSPKY